MLVSTSPLPQSFLYFQLISAATLQELGKLFWSAKTKTEKETQAAKNITAWSQPPFFSLLLTCIKCQEEQKPLLTSLFNQLNDFILVCCIQILFFYSKFKL